MGLFAKFKEAWLKPMSFDSLNEGFYDDLEEALILADVGMDTAVDAVAQLKKRAYAKLLTHEEDVKNALRDILAEKLSVGDPALDLSTRPSVALIIGVNGVGKTTSIGKLAHRLKNEGKKVLLCAGDTFRAAAADQLEICLLYTSRPPPAAIPPRRISTCTTCFTTASGSPGFSMATPISPTAVSYTHLLRPVRYFSVTSLHSFEDFSLHNNSI